MGSHRQSVSFMLRTLREFRKLSVMDCAERSGLSMEDYQAIEAQTRDVSMDELARLGTTLQAVLDIRMTPVESPWLDKR